MRVIFCMLLHIISSRKVKVMNLERKGKKVRIMNWKGKGHLNVLSGMYIATQLTKFAWLQ